MAKQPEAHRGRDMNQSDYDAWLRARVEESLADPRPSIPHDEVMAEMEAIIQAAERRR